MAMQLASINAGAAFTIATLMGLLPVRNRLDGRRRAGTSSA